MIGRDGTRERVIEMYEIHRRHSLDLIAAHKEAKTTCPRPEAKAAFFNTFGYPAHKIKTGDSYYWWKFRRGGKRYSKTHPRPSQLTQSGYLSTAYALQEQIEDMQIVPGDLQAAADELRNVADEIRTLGQEQEDRIGNMPDSLQESDSAQLLRGRAEACESLADELESAASEIEDLDPAGEPGLAEWTENQQDELVGRVEDTISGIGWNFES